MTASPPGWQPLAAIGVTLVLWASAFVAIRHLGHDVSPGALSLGRLLIAAVALSVLLARAPRTRFTRVEVGLLLGCGIAWFGIYNLALNAIEQKRLLAQEANVRRMIEIEQKRVEERPEDKLAKKARVTALEGQLVEVRARISATMSAAIARLL